MWPRRHFGPSSSSAKDSLKSLTKEVSADELEEGVEGLDSSSSLKESPDEELLLNEISL